jgi:cytoskeletal protein CcmA (bactofilin family)
MEEALKKIMTPEEIEKELRMAAIEKRAVDFKDKIIQEINLSDRTIESDISFEGTKFLNLAYFNRAVIKGNLNLENVTVKNSLYLGEATIEGELNCKGILVGEVFNLVGIKVSKDMVLEEAIVKGFLSLNKAEITGSIRAKKIAVQDSKTLTGTIRGDIHLQKTNVIESVDFEEAFVDGLMDFQESFIQGNLNLSRADIGEFLILKNSSIQGEVNLTELKCKEKVS